MTYKLTVADQIWNRATLDAGGSELRAGDRALAGMLRVHSLIMNGGIMHAVECLTQVELTEGLEGYEFFDLHNLSMIVNRISSMASDEELEEADQKYYETGDDSILSSKFEKRYADQPELFAPL